MTIKNNGTIYRTNKYLHFIPKNKKSNDINGEKLFEIVDDESYHLKLNHCKLDDTENLYGQNSAWFILKKEKISPRSNKYNLKEGDIIKIGKISFLVRSIKFTKDENNRPHSSKISIDVNKKNKKYLPLKSRFSENSTYKKSKSLDEKEKNKTCRICYSEEENIENPLIQPCNCSGSLKYIHLNCLKHWLKNSVYNLVQSNENYCVYNYKQPHCELCKTKFSDYIMNNGKLYEILDLHTNINFHNYMILESLILDKHNNKYFFIISLDKQKINIGRGKESDVIFSDYSVSRCHCSLTIDNKSKKVFLHDENSRCGTLILIQSDYITLALEMELNIQIGNTHFEIFNKKNFCLFDCCDVAEKLNDDFYYNQNEVDISKFENIKFKNESDYEEESVKDIEYEEKNVESEKISTKNICDAINHDESEEEKIEIYNEGHVIYN